MLRSQLCSAQSLRSPALRAWADRLRPLWAADDDQREVMLHRKMWEWLFIAEALRERGMLAAGRRGLGFGVGYDPLVALFAAEGCEVVATDQPPGPAAAPGATDRTAAWADGPEALNRAGLCPADDFARRVHVRSVDMNAVPEDLRGFDFSWSSGAVEHLGTLGAGADFVVAQMDCLRPGGVAVHTTEFLVSSDVDTVEAGGSVFYRRRDVEALAARLRRAGDDIDVDYALGSDPEDVHVDVPPFSDVHLRTELGGYVTTSVALVVTKGARRRPGWWRTWTGRG
jgi:hypothetical protein